jgi:hypothetical protein
LPRAALARRRACQAPRLPGAALARRRARRTPRAPDAAVTDAAVSETAQHRCRGLRSPPPAGVTPRVPSDGGVARPSRPWSAPPPFGTSQLFQLTRNGRPTGVIRRFVRPLEHVMFQRGRHGGCRGDRPNGGWRRTGKRPHPHAARHAPRAVTRPAPPAAARGPRRRGPCRGAPGR